MSRKQCVDNSYLSVSYYSRLANSPCSGYVQPGSDVCGFVDWFVLGVCELVCFGDCGLVCFGGCGLVCFGLVWLLMTTGVDQPCCCSFCFCFVLLLCRSLLLIALI